LYCQYVASFFKADDTVILIMKKLLNWLWNAATSGGANGCLVTDDDHTMPNMNEDDDDDDDLDVADDIEAQKKQCIEVEPVSGVEDEPPAQNISRFDHKQKKGFVDVWWLFDDGGRPYGYSFMMQL